MQLNPVVPFKQSRAMALARAANVNPMSGTGRGNRAYGVPGYPAGVRLSGLPADYPYGSGIPAERYGSLRLGNMSAGLSDYINTPGTPGSSTFFLYGLGQPDAFDTAASPSEVAMSPGAAVTPSSSDSFLQTLRDIAQTAIQAAPAVLQVVNQQNALQALNAGKITQAQYQAVMQNPTATIALQPSAGLATGLKIGGGTIALIGAGLLAVMLLKKR